MKKSILAGSVALALGMTSSQLVAQEIVVNGTVVDGVTIQDFVYDVAANRLQITTSDSSQALQLPGTTDPTDPTDATDPTDPTDPTDSTDPTDPTDPTDTTDPAPSGVEIRYSISDLMTDTGYVDMSIPAGTVLASRFVVPTDTTFRGAEFKLQNISNNRTRAWISSEPGDTNSIAGCDLTSSFTYRMTFSLPSGNKACKLQSGSVYYLNMKNADSSTVGAAVTRQINLDIETLVIEFDWSAFM